MAKKNDSEQMFLFGQEPLEAPEVKEEKKATAVAEEIPVQKETIPAAPKAKEATIEEKIEAATKLVSEIQTQQPVVGGKRKRGRPPQKLVQQIREQREAGVLIPNKMYFAISEVAEICGVKPYVLRYWESEFKLLRPSKNPSGQRMYQKKDIEMVFRIKRSLYDEGFTIAGAKKKLREDKKEEAAQGVHKAKAALAKIRGELSNLLGKK